jgi:hypothetical protein
MKLITQWYTVLVLLDTFTYKASLCLFILFFKFLLENNITIITTINLSIKICQLVHVENKILKYT